MTAGFVGQLRDHAGEVVGNLANRLVREHLRVRLRLLDRLRVVRPARRERGVAGLLEQRGPPIPAAREQPQAVDEHDRCLAGAVGLVDLLLLVLGERAGHAVLQCV